MEFSAFLSAPALPEAAVYLFSGEEGLLREKGVQALKERRPEWREGTVRYASSEVTLPKLLEELHTPSLLGGSKLVILADEGNFVHNHTGDFERYLAAPARSATLALLAGGKVPRIKGQGLLEIRCLPLRSLDLVRWVTADVQRHGKTVNRPAVQLLIDRAGEDLGVLEGHVRNLVQYAGSRANITPDDVQALVSDQGTHAAYELALAAASKKMGRALEILHRLLAGGEPAPVLLWRLAWQYRKMLDAKRLLAAGVRRYEIPSRVQITYYPDEFLGLVDGHALDELLAKHQNILDADVALKTSGGLDVLLLEKLVCELASERVRAPV